ncbi:MAG TPA: TolC family protein [Terriglobales bacterium]|jgi:outer membrane protein|nr:TolC family protein [Terriglobales bacterium]
MFANIRVSLLICASLLFNIASLAEPVPFKRAIELAIHNSTTTTAASADVNRLQALYLEARDQYIPQVYFGSGLAYSFGFPLGEPSIFKVSSTSLLLNFAQREFIKAARSDIRAATANKDEKKGQVILETALSYSELDKNQASISILQQQEQAAVKFESIEQQRIDAGVDPAIELTRAKLNTARIRLKIAQLLAGADTLRLRLSQLTGLPAKEFETVTESIPRLPEVSQEDDLATRAIAFSPTVKGAQELAAAKLFQARGEHKQLYPAVDLVGQYALFAKYNNYDQYYKTFKHNNGALGVEIRFPFLNKAQKDHSEALYAEAHRARKDADAAKEQVSTETLKLQRTVAQLSAAREVAKLEYQLSQNNTQAMQAKVDSGQATLRDQQQVQLDENDKYSALLDATYELDKAQMQLLKQTGDLEKWALSTP